MMRTVRAARNSTKIAMTMRTMTPASMAAPVLDLGHERRRAPAPHDMNPPPGLVRVGVVVRAGGPDLPLEPHRADVLVIGDTFEDDRRLTDERGGAGPQLR